MNLVIGNKNYSSWSLRPWLLMDAHQLQFETIELSLRPEGRKERLEQYSSSAKVPVLIDGDLHINDSLAICEYLSENYLNGNGWPKNRSKRALARTVSAEMHSGFTALRSEMPMNCRANRSIEISSSCDQDIKRIDFIFSRYAEETADGEIRLFGEFSIADCFFAPVILRFATYAVQLSDPAQAYANSLLEHPSLKSWVAIARLETEILQEDETGIDRAI